MIESIRPARPLVFVPGILDSQLWDPETGAHLWPPAGWQETGRFAARSLKLLVTVRPKTADLLLPGMYDEILRAFHEMGYREDEQPGRPRNLWVFVYDWTRSNQDSGRELAAFISDHVLRSHNGLHPEAPWDDVDVVSHSMGGIVTRAAIQLFQAPIRRAVYIASPHYGTPLAYFALQPGIGLTPTLGLFMSLMGDAIWGKFFRQSEDERSLEAQLRWVAARLPSVFELLPDEFYLTDERPMVIVRSGLIHAPVTGPADTYWINPASRFVDREHRRRAMEAMAFKSQLGRRLPGEKLVVYSNTEVTPDQVVYRLGGFGRPYDSGQHGDQSVAADSAIAGLNEAQLVAGTHEGLPNSRETHRLIAAFLGDRNAERTTAVGTTPDTLAPRSAAEGRGSKVAGCVPVDP